MLRSALAAALLALNAPPSVPADYQACSTVHPGPIQRPDHYSTQLYGRKADLA